MGDASRQGSRTDERGEPRRPADVGRREEGHLHGGRRLPSGHFSRRVEEHASRRTMGCRAIPEDGHWEEGAIPPWIPLVERGASLGLGVFLSVQHGIVSRCHQAWAGCDNRAGDSGCITPTTRRNHFYSIPLKALKQHAAFHVVLYVLCESDVATLLAVHSVPAAASASDVHVESTPHVQWMYSFCTSFPVTDSRAVCAAGDDLPRRRKTRRSAHVLQARVCSRHEELGQSSGGRSNRRHSRRPHFQARSFEGAGPPPAQRPQRCDRKGEMLAGAPETQTG